jgi:hypothetical protein
LQYEDVSTHKLNLVVYYGNIDDEDVKRIIQPIASYIPNAWNTFVLETPLLLNEAKDLKFGIEIVEHDAGIDNFVVGTDARYATDPDGSIYSDDDGRTWHRLFDEIDDEGFPVMPNNFAIIGNLSDIVYENTTSRAVNHDVNTFLGYIIRRDGDTQGKMLYQTYYRDSPINVTKNYNYTISAYYKNGVETELSDIFTFDKDFPVIMTAILPNGEVETEYHPETIVATGAEVTAWEIDGGKLPTGLKLENGIISGTPTKEGLFTFIVKATNSKGSATRGLSITIEPKSAIKNMQSSALTAYAQNGILHVSGLMPGETFSLYTITGILVAESRRGEPLRSPDNGEVTIKLPANGIYIVKAGNKVAKVTVL